MRFRLLAPPAIEPVSPADVMAFARIDTDPGDGVLQRLLVAARQRVERDTGLALVSQTWVASLDRWPTMPPPDYRGGALASSGVSAAWSGAQDGSVVQLSTGGVIEIPRRPFQSLVSFQVRDITTAFQSVDPATFYVETGNETGRIVRKPGTVWPLVIAGMDDAIELTVVLGFGASAASVPSDLQTAILMLAAHWHEAREPVFEGRSTALPEHVRSILSSWQGRRLR